MPKTVPPGSITTVAPQVWSSPQVVTSRGSARLAKDRTKPTVPTNVVAQATSPTTVSLTWDASTDPVVAGETTSGMKEYRIFRNSTRIATTDKSVREYTDTGRTPGAIYQYRIAAVDKQNNQSGQSPQVTVTMPSVVLDPDVTAPSVPLNLLATADSETQITLTWSASTDPTVSGDETSGVAGYKVYRDGSPIATLGLVTTYPNTGLTAATEYSYRVSAIDVAGNESAQSSASVATTTSPGENPDITAPSVPAGFTATATTATTIELNWSASTDPIIGGAETSGVAGYQIRRGGTLIASVGLVTTYVDSGRAPDTTYSYTIAALDVAGNASAQSGSQSATTPASSGGTVNAASASEAHVQAAIASASVGDTVVVPSGTGTWNTLSLNKAITLQGAGIGSTVITLGTGNSISKQSTGVTRMHGFTFNRSGGGNAAHGFTISGGWTSAEPVVIENCRHNVSSSGLYQVSVIGGLVFAKCSFYGLWDDSFIRPKIPGNNESWQADDTLGARDTNGRRNIYVEDCYFYGGTNQGIDADDASRFVCRYNRFDYGSFNSHGLDTSDRGVRHWEVYGNAFRNNAAGGHTGSSSIDDISNQNWAIWIRGATGVIFNNYLDNLANSFWGPKSEAKFDIRAVQDGTGSGYGYFSDGRAKYSSGFGTYPRQNQLSLNWSNSLSNSVNIHGGVGDYFIDPIYIWGNTGPGSNASGGVLGFANGGSWAGGQASYFVEGRDYFNNGTQRPGYSAFAYPHPLRVTSGQAF